MLIIELHNHQWYQIPISRPVSLISRGVFSFNYLWWLRHNHTQRKFRNFFSVKFRPSQLKTSVDLFLCSYSQDWSTFPRDFSGVKQPFLPDSTYSLILCKLSPLAAYKRSFKLARRKPIDETGPKGHLRTYFTPILLFYKFQNIIRRNPLLFRNNMFFNLLLRWLHDYFPLVLINTKSFCSAENTLTFIILSLPYSLKFSASSNIFFYTLTHDCNCI